MELRISEVEQLDERLWKAQLSPHDVRKLGNGGASIGVTSVVILEGGAFDAESGVLSFDINDASVLNVGSTDDVLLLNGASEAEAVDKSNPRAFDLSFRQGDRAFLDQLRKVPSSVADAGEALLQYVRGHHPGELKQVGDWRFQETPDNFWFVTIQPRDESLAVHVRGLPERFEGTPLQVSRDRRPYSRFKIRTVQDAVAGARILERALRKP